jgi:hypothetical protein
LREQAERLLDLSQSAGDFFKGDTPALQPAPPDAAQVLSAAELAFDAELPEAKWIGPCKLLQRLGQGGYRIGTIRLRGEPFAGCSPMRRLPAGKGMW